MKFFDKNGKEIKAGMYIKFPDGSIEKVFKTTDDFGNESLGINASNDSYMKANNISEEDREFYSLLNFNLKEVEIYDNDLKN